MKDDSWFTARQTKFIVAMSITAAILGVVFILKNFSQTSSTPRPFSVIVAEADEMFTGLFIVDPNSSPADSLELLPGIGPILADRIVAYRQQQPFKSEIDLINVNGIGPHLFEKIKPYLKVHKP